MQSTNSREFQVSAVSRDVDKSKINLQIQVIHLADKIIAFIKGQTSFS